MKIIPVPKNQTQNFQSRNLILPSGRIVNSDNVAINFRDGHVFLDITENYTQPVPHQDFTEAWKETSHYDGLAKIESSVKTVIPYTRYVNETKQKIVSVIIKRPITTVARIFQIAKSTDGPDINIMSKLSDILKTAPKKI